MGACVCLCKFVRVCVGCCMLVCACECVCECAGCVGFVWVRMCLCERVWIRVYVYTMCFVGLCCCVCFLRCKFVGFRVVSGVSLLFVCLLPLLF